MLNLALMYPFKGNAKPFPFIFLNQSNLLLSFYIPSIGCGVYEHFFIEDWSSCMAD
jgi:hypothetical protein